MKVTYPDYDRSILSVTASVLGHFGVAGCPHQTLPELDALLEKGYRHIVLMLFDGLGVSALHKHLPEDAFLRRQLLTCVSSVFPPTTVAATTVFNTGKSPAENGWLGWDQYFEEIGENVTVFRNTLQSTGAPAADYDLPQKAIPYISVFDRIKEASPGAEAFAVSPFSKHRIKSVRKLTRTVRRLTKSGKNQYIYTYWYQPDSLMHKYGVGSPEVKKCVRALNKKLERLCGKLKDTLIIVTADHGHIDAKPLYLEDYPDILEMLIRPTSIEPRALALFVKEPYKDVFTEKWNAVFGEHFLLLSSEEALSMKLFGGGEAHPRTEGFIGDFLAVATGEYYINNRRGGHVFKGVHAGLTEDEMTVPLIAVEKPL